MKISSNIVIIALIIAAVWIPLYIIQYSDINRERYGCDRLNVVRTQLYSTIVIATNLVKENPPLVEKFIGQQENLIASVKMYEDESTKNPVDIDCDNAYPAPVPSFLK